MIYDDNKKKSSLDRELFKSPPAEYRAAPFWAWNCELSEEALHKEIDFMKEMGMGGFHMHTRVGQSTEYLSEDYMNFIKSCTEKAKKENMLAWLYDEDKWPSGFAGGYVTKKKENETDKEKIKRLEEENLYLKAELEYSKKLRAVVQARKNQQQKKKEML